MFPEGTRSRTGELQPFKNAPFGLAIAAQVPIVPLYVDGTYRILPKGGLRLHPMPIRIEIGEPIPTAGLTRGRSRQIARPRAGGDLRRSRRALTQAPRSTRVGPL